MGQQEAIHSFSAPGARKTRTVVFSFAFIRQVEFTLTPACRKMCLYACSSTHDPRPYLFLHPCHFSPSRHCIVPASVMDIFSSRCCPTGRRRSFDPSVIFAFSYSVLHRSRYFNRVEILSSSSPSPLTSPRISSPAPLFFFSWSPFPPFSSFSLCPPVGLFSSPRHRWFENARQVFIFIFFLHFSRVSLFFSSFFF